MSHHNIVQTRIEMMTIIDSGRYQDQIRTPYRAQFREDLADELIEGVARTMRPKETVHNRTFLGVATDFLAPDLSERRVAHIENGWGERRKRWILLLEHRTRQGQRYMQYITGYSRDDDIVSHGGKFDEQAVMYINNSIMFAEKTFADSSGRQRSVWSPKYNNQIIADRQYRGAVNSRGSFSHLMRPHDVYQHIGVMSYMNEMQSSRVIASTAVANTEAQASRRSNNDPTSYLSNILGQYSRNLTQNAHVGAPHEIVVDKAFRNCAETSINSDPFLDFLRRRNNSVNHTSEFELGDLLNLDPDMPQIDYVVQEAMVIDHSARNTLFVDVNHTEESLDWRATTPHNELGKILANTMPGLLVDNALAAMGLVIDNDTRDGSWNFTPSNCHGWIRDMEMTSAMDAVIYGIIDTVLDPWNSRRDAGIEMVLYCDVAGDTTMHITIEGVTERLVLPTFTDHLNPPVLGGEIDDVANIASVFDKVMRTAYKNFDDVQGGGAAPILRDEPSSSGLILPKSLSF